jgi:hypothetical protein
MRTPTQSFEKRRVVQSVAKFRTSLDAIPGSDGCFLVLTPSLQHFLFALFRSCIEKMISTDNINGVVRIKLP